MEKLLATTEFRELSPTAKAAKLIIKGVCSARAAAQAQRVSRSSAIRAVAAIKNNKNVGQNGRPRYLNSNEEEELAQEIRRRVESRERLTLNTVSRLVIFAR
jgi:transposase